MASKGKSSREAAAAKLEQAKKELSTMTGSLVKRYANDGLIYRRTRDFAYEYERGVKNIVRPFASARNADALAELSVARLAQLRRVSIDDEGEFLIRSWRRLPRSLIRRLITAMPSNAQGCLRCSLRI